MVSFPRLCCDVKRRVRVRVQVTDVMVSRDCFHCVAACTDGCIYTYNLRTTELLDVFSASRCGPATVCFSRDEYFIFSAAKVGLSPTHGHTSRR